MLGGAIAGGVMTGGATSREDAEELARTSELRGAAFMPRSGAAFAARAERPFNSTVARGLQTGGRVRLSGARAASGETKEAEKRSPGHGELSRRPASASRLLDRVRAAEPSCAVLHPRSHLGPTVVSTLPGEWIDTRATL